MKYSGIAESKTKLCAFTFMGLYEEENATLDTKSREQPLCSLISQVAKVSKQVLAILLIQHPYSSTLMFHSNTNYSSVEIIYFHIKHKSQNPTNGAK